MANQANIIIDGVEQVVGLSTKNFSTGSKGFNGTGKMVVNGKRYQIGINVVEIGSKPKKEK